MPHLGVGSAAGERISLSPQSPAKRIVDAHIHVWTGDMERYPLAPGFAKKDLWLPSFTPADHVAYSHSVGPVRLNLVQMFWYGTDHSYILDLIASDDYVADLRGVLVQGAPTVIITEGILSYFSMDQQQRIFDKIAALLRWCGGGTYMTDIHHQDEVDRLGSAAALFRWGLHKLSDTEQTALIPNFGAGQQMLAAAGFSDIVGLHPNQWHEELSLPLLRKDSGLMIYEAKIS